MFIPKSIVQIIEIQRKRYTRKGPKNILIALSLLFILLKGAQKICEYVWPQQIQDKQKFVVGISCFLHFGLQILYSLIYAPGYLNLFDVYEKYRINKGVKRVWQIQLQWPQRRKKLLKYLFINQCLIYPGLIIVSTRLSGIKLRFQGCPSMYQLGWQLFLVSIIQDTVFYWLHRLSHEIKFLYKFHKMHHQYTENFTFVTEYTHPIDYVLSVLIPAAFPFIVLGSKVHCFMFFFWQVWKIYTSTQSHSGYYFPWSPSRVMPFISDSSFHDFHHSKNIGNYGGIIYLWDYFMDSSKLYFSLWNKSPQNLNPLRLKKQLKDQ